VSAHDSWRHLNPVPPEANVGPATIYGFHGSNEGVATVSSGWNPTIAKEAPPAMRPIHFMSIALIAATDWLWSGIPTRFPQLKIAMSGGPFQVTGLYKGAFRVAVQGDLSGLSYYGASRYVCG
jgi:hypothetical protein